MAITPKKVFFLDASGAILSAFMLGVVLVYLQSYIGMPISALYALAIAAIFFAIYSSSCYFLIKTNWNPYLRTIAIVNSIYCVVSIALVIYHYDLLSALGVFYFIAELIVLGIIIYIEFKSLKSIE